MTKVKNLLVITVTFILILMVGSTSYATTLSKVEYANSKVRLTGTCETGEQVQVVIFDLNKEPMYFATVDVENKKFTKTLEASFEFKEGETYTVKVADYNGKSATSSTFVAEETNKGEKDETPKTGNIGYIDIMSIIVISLILVLTVTLKKK